MKTLFQKIGYNFAISFIGKIISIVLSFFIVSFMARYLGRNGFGDYTTVLAFLYFFGVAADAGLYLYLVREISQKEGAQEEFMASNVFYLRSFLALLIMSLAPLVVIFMPYSALVKEGVLLGSLGYFFLSLSQILIAIFQKKLKMWVAGMADVLGRVIQLVLLVIFIKFNFGFLAFVFTFVASTFTTFLFSFLFTNNIIKINLGFDFSYWKKVVKNSIPFAISIVLSLIYFKIDTVMLSLMKPSGDVGIYGVAYKILETVIVFPSMLTGLFLPFFTAFKDDTLKFKEIAEKSGRFLVLSSLGAVFGGFIMAGPIIKVIAGQEFLASILVLKILIFAVGVIFISSYFGHLIVALGLQQKMNKAYLICVVFNILLNLIVIPRYSYIGAASSTLATEILVFIFAVIIVYRKVGWVPRFEGFLKMVFASVLMSFLLLSFINFNYYSNGILKLGGGILAGAVIYLASLIILKVLSFSNIKDFILRRQAE